MSLINREDVLALIPKHVSPAMASDLADAIAALPAQVGEPVGTVVAIAGDLRELRVIEWRNAAPAVGAPLYASPPPDRPCPHVRTSRGGTSYCELARISSFMAAAPGEERK